MCVTIGPAKLSNTILYAGQALQDEKVVHVLGYQNRMQNLQDGPNAMILPFPNKAPMGPENIIDTSKHKRILKDIAASIETQTIALNATKGSDSLRSACCAVQVFESGEYTVVLATNADLIPEALALVPENKRPNIKPEFFQAYNQWYPNWSIALCCWEGKAKVDASPLLWWYEPKSTKFFFLPGLDGHGEVPKLDEHVWVDHIIAVGCGDSIGNSVYYSDVKVEDDIQKYLSSRVVGQEMQGLYSNGDFYVTLGQKMSKDKNLFFKDKLKIGRFRPSTIQQMMRETINEP